MDFFIIIIFSCWGHAECRSFIATGSLYGHFYCPRKSFSCSPVRAGFESRTKESPDLKIQRPRLRPLHYLPFPNLLAVINDAVGGPFEIFLVVFDNGLNAVFSMVDSLVAQDPIRFWHFWWAIGYGILYLAFSAVYQAAGGTGFCR